MLIDFEGGGRGEITVDSGAEESVCPVEWAPNFGVRPSERIMKFKGADGTEIKHYGQKEIIGTYPRHLF